MASGVQAAAGDPISVDVAVVRQHEDNLFRLPDGVDAVSRLGREERADVVTSIGGGVAIDKTLSLQRFRLDASGRDVRYRHFETLDHRSSKVRGEWLWSVSDVLSGSLGTSRERVLTGFSDFRPASVVRNLETRFEHSAKMDWRLGARWHVDAGLLHRASDNSTSARQSADYRNSEVMFGLRYVDAVGREIVLRQRELHGEYPNRLLSPLLDNDFSQHNSEASVSLPLTGASRVYASLGRVGRSYDEVPQRDYAGNYGHAGWDWTSGGKSSFSAVVRRELATLEDFRASYQDIRTVSLMPAWAASERIVVRGRFDRSRRTHEGDPGFVSGGLSPRIDRHRTRSVTVVFDARRWLQLNALWQDDRRDSSVEGFQYRAKVWSLGLATRF